mmetsp:Transcript_57149/g.68325  ORF Transcript_57149/g.68325 Transcript_57149/m.68325 type:complete len:188 (-) Transcript_57149:239-802(-)|eukprot:CAMPEP_0172494580 /NCGR_PEP_ID=MMETSP1066-20121228/51233_1 /TAXON_ID=671091 /ORGANISM="Coscinodiscus wailesii, Strain CCMP2513" /LENGTH=187 /DNA_ID=CAMNT_0013265667 /DNA_START=54 /DNA_END=617 /DNA_ORIENTATION=+
MKFSLLFLLGFSTGAPVFDIGLDTCSFTESSDDIHVGDIFCTFNTKGDIGHSVSSAVYASDCSSPAPPDVTQDTNPTFTLDSGSQERSTYDVTISLTSTAVPRGATAIDFCLKTEVKGSDGEVYDLNGQKIALAFDIDGTLLFITSRDITISGGASIRTSGGERQLVRIERKPSVLDPADFSMAIEV